MALNGIIDLGSNTVRLVVYDVKERLLDKKIAPHERNRLFKSIVNEKKTAGLSAYVEDGAFSRAGIDAAIKVLEKHLATAHNVGCSTVHIFATAVIRNCSNSKDAARRISKAIDTPIDVISATDEAHLGFVGASCDRVIENGTLVDIGGGSTELTTVRDEADSHNISLPQGSVSSYAQYVKFILPNPEECAAIVQEFRRHLASTDLNCYCSKRLYGIGGSVRAIDKLYAETFSHDSVPARLEPYQIDALKNLLLDQPSTFAHAATRAIPERLHSVVPGMVIVRELMTELGAKSLTICKHGVREGYLLERVLQV